MSTSETASFPAGTILGYPRIGRRRELKKAIESFWAGKTTEEQLCATTAELRATTRARQVELGLGATDSSIPESFSYYDQVLDAATTFGLVPARFARYRDAQGRVGLEGYFAQARGTDELPPLEMTKWFDSNYHYLVPEISSDTLFALSSAPIREYAAEAREQGLVTRPSLLGPVSLLLLAKPESEAAEGFDPLERLDELVGLYRTLLAELHADGVEWVQLDESALVIEVEDADERARTIAAVTSAYATLGAETNRPALFVASGYGSLGDAWAPLVTSGIEAIGVDVLRGTLPTPLELPSSVALVAGVVDGRNVWRADLSAKLAQLEELRAQHPLLSVSTSTSLQHVPHDTADEPTFDARVLSWLAFADQKIAEVGVLTAGLANGRDSVSAALAEAAAARADRASAPGVQDGAVRAREAALTDASFERVAYAERQQAQQQIGLPLLPTTTIGSFPQTPEIRRARAQHVSGALADAEYTAVLSAEVDRVIGLQEELGLDVLVHGEPERNDMVQYFAERLDGFDVTTNGWVQSYGTRCTRPSILWGDVSRPVPMTVEWSEYAQSRTAKPVKGMLTGPVTILAWSFVRDDQPLGETARQVAFALADEISDLEKAGIRIIQVDEPALRELLPISLDARPAYVDWSVGSFRLSTAAALPETAVHTHLCYSEFGTVIDAIRALDADVTSIESARSRMEVVADLDESGFDHGVGPGVYDIHSPRVPSVDEIVELLDIALEGVSADRLWVNPDCGLKTRAYPETEASLANLVEATLRVRSRIGALTEV